MAAAAPTMTGVTGTVASIDTPDGKKQLTLGGWPLYYWAKDTKPGDVTGQAVKDVWWVLDAAGTPIKTKPAS
jgi:predicted lipoprotein with Yx(FWY)xxD motif